MLKKNECYLKINLGVLHEALGVFVANQLRQQAIVDLAWFHHFDCCIITVP